VVVANGHISDRTFRRGMKLRAHLGPILKTISQYLAQSESIRARAIALGLPEEQVTVAGHTKFDQSVATFTVEETATIRARLGLSPDQPLLLAGSTHDGEEEQVLEAWETARQRVPDLALMLAPRHLNRLEAIHALLQARGLSAWLWSEAGIGGRVAGATGADGAAVEAASPAATECLTAEAGRSHTVLVLDTMGELARFYGLASVAFVGGSLVPKGGHDILQPLFHGVPTLFGRYMHNQRSLARCVLEEGAGHQVEDGADLGKVVTELLTDETKRRSLRQAGARLLAEDRGASTRCAEAVAALLRGSERGAPLPETLATTVPLSKP
jgi:3-deoxy-D-manno-octulosonic-acid transferase